MKKRQGPAKGRKKRIREAAGVALSKGERDKALARAGMEVDFMDRGIRAFSYAGKIRKHLKEAGAQPEDIGLTEEKLDQIEERLKREASEEFERMRETRSVNGSLLIVLRRDMQDGDYSPEDFGTTEEEMERFETMAREQEEREQELRSEARL